MYNKGDKMNYFKEYTEKLLTLQNGDKTKINIHFIVSEPLTSFCFNVNQNIKKHNFGLINMGVESIVVPHISLFMGFVDSFEMLEKVFCEVYKYAQKLTPFSFDPTNIYFKRLYSTEPQYLFIDSLQTDFLMRQKEELDNILKEIVYPLDWNMKQERPHVTVGCYKNITPSVCQIIDSYNMIPSCRISQIGVSLSGKYGVCLGLLKVFDL